MITWIAFFRGINVGGNNIVPMASLTALLSDLGLTNIATYIQSGNVVFHCVEADPETLAESIASEIEARHGFRPKLLLISLEQLERAVASNPFSEAEDVPKTLHLFFLTEPAAQPDLDALDTARTPSERFRIIDKVFYLHAPDGIGRSKLAAQVERYLGVDATARNWRTVLKTLELARQCESAGLSSPQG
ncbi:MAG: DUF1697 domain-containing protein [Pseudomonadota bacterium]